MMHKLIRLAKVGFLSLLLACVLGLPTMANAQVLQTSRLSALAMHGEPAFSGTSPLPYAHPRAPKGGKIELGLQGTFDSLNPFNLKAGSTAQGLNGNIFQTLMIRSLDEPFTLYGLIAETFETDTNRSYILFHLNPNAHFADGHPLTTEDVQFSFNLLKTQGRPQQRIAYAQVKRVEVLSAQDIRFDLAGIEDREMPLTLGLMPILPKHATDVAHFSDSSLTLPLGSGPYIIESIVPGVELTLRRDPHYWAANLPISQGLYNFDTIHISYMRDNNAVFEAFKAGLVDFRTETDASRWLNAYDFPAVKDGRILREAQPFGLPKGMDGFAFNTRRSLFSEKLVREALSMMFDFEWVNAKLYGGLFRRSTSFFDDSALSSHGHPASAAELALLNSFPGLVREDILAGTWSPPKSDGSGHDRAIARQALDLLDAAGYRLDNATLITPRGEPFSFEIMVESREKERLALVYAENLHRIGITARVRYVDEVQYQRRRQRYDFDMMIGSWVATPSPGNEQRGRWGSAAAKAEGTFNLTGAASPAIDSLIEAIVNARSEGEFTDAVRAFDRVLLSGFYIVPLFYKPDQWIAYSAHLAKPEHVPMFGITPDPVQSLATWWSKNP
jgi:peptide/nickel transport system substrate-binding protein